MTAAGRSRRRMALFAAMFAASTAVGLLARALPNSDAAELEDKGLELLACLGNADFEPLVDCIGEDVQVEVHFRVPGMGVRSGAWCVRRDAIREYAHLFLERYVGFTATPIATTVTMPAQTVANVRIKFDWVYYQRIPGSDPVGSQRPYLCDLEFRRKSAGEDWILASIKSAPP